MNNYINIVFAIITFVIIISNSSVTYASKYNDDIIFVANQYLSVREFKNRNDAPEIDKWLLNVGLDNKSLTIKGKQGYSWCAAYSLSMYKETYSYHQESNPVKSIQSARCSEVWKLAKKDKYKFITIPAKRIYIGAEKMREADMIIWSHKKINDNFNGHFGLTINQYSPYRFKSIEGNTTGSNDISQQREQTGYNKDIQKNGGVRIKDRKIDPYSNDFMFEGIIRLND